MLVENLNQRPSKRGEQAPLPSIPVPVLEPTSTRQEMRPGPMAGTVIPQEALFGSDFTFDEANNLTPVSPTHQALSVPVDNNLPYRKIYAYLWTNPSTATDYFFDAEIQLWRGDSKVGFLPLSEGVCPAGGGVMGRKSRVTIAIGSGAGNVVDNSLALYLWNPTGSQPTTGIVLQPQCLYADIDRLTVAITGKANVTDARIWLGCISSKEY